jgi:hypothetical protein
MKKRRSRLHEDYKRSVHELFVLAVELSEIAHEAAIAGQKVHTPVEQLSALAATLSAAGTNLATLAKAIEVAVNTRLK